MALEPEPFSFDSINRFHDAIEMFLALAVQEHGVAIPKDFTGYWDALQPPLGRPLAHRARLQKFNKLRVNLKHYGVEPAASEIAEAGLSVASLISDECRPLFGVDLEDVSLTAFVSCQEARQLLESAERHWEDMDRLEAMADLADSFETLIRDYEQRKMLGGVSVFDNARDMTFESPFFRGVQGRQKRFEEKIIQSLKDLDFAVMLLGLGVDFRRYGKFKALTPIVFHVASGRRIVHARDTAAAPERSDYEFCRDLIVTTAIHLSEFDYDLEWSHGLRAAAAEQLPGDSSGPPGHSGDVDEGGNRTSP